MIVISFSPQLVTDLELLHKISDADLFGDILTIAIDIIANKKPSNKMLNKLTQVFGGDIDTSAVERCLNGLSALLVDCGKKNVPPSQFSAALIDHFGFTQIQSDILSAQYKTKFSQLRHALHNKVTSGVNYVSFDWRFDVEIASRSANSTFTPTYLCALTLQDQDKKEPQTTILQASPTVMSMIHDELTTAIAEAKTAHSRRIQKYVK